MFFLGCRQNFFGVRNDFIQPTFLNTKMCLPSTNICNTMRKTTAKEVEDRLEDIAGSEIICERPNIDLLAFKKRGQAQMHKDWRFLS